MRPVLLSIILASALGAAAGSAGAQTTDGGLETQNVVVRYGDLDLQRPTDASTLLARLRTAALSACGAGFESLPEYRAAVGRSPCYKDSLYSAVASLDAPLVTRIYNNRRVTVASN